MWDSIKDYLKPELIWFLVGLALLVMEFMTPGLIIFFFGVGAWIVATICLFVDISINLQLGIFIAASVLSLVLLRKWLKGTFMGHVRSKQDTTENMEDYVGQRATVVEKIVPTVGGKVEFHGTNWEAQANSEIEEGAVVEITGKNNLTLKVKAL